MKIVYVSIGHPALPIPVQERCAVNLEALTKAHGKSVISLREAGKLFRLEAVKNLPPEFDRKIHWNPSDFYWAVFENLSDVTPVVASDNYYWKFGVRKVFGDPRPPEEISCKICGDEALQNSALPCPVCGV